MEKELINYSLSFKIRQVVAQSVQKIRYFKYRLRGYDIDPSTQIERRVNLDRINPKGIHIGKDCIITSDVVIMSHNLVPVRYTGSGGGRFRYVGTRVDTYIGDNCVIGVGSIIKQGVRIGNNCVVGFGSVVTKDVPDNSIVAGNPAQIIRTIITLDGVNL